MTNMNNMMLVSALLLTVAIPHQFEPPTFSNDAELHAFMSLNFFAFASYLFNIIFGVLLAHNLNLVIFPMASYCTHCKHYKRYLVWWNLWILGVAAHCGALGLSVIATNT